MKWILFCACALALGFGFLSADAAAGNPSGPDAEGRFLNQIRQLTFEGKRSGEGYLSPDGLSLIFQSERSPENPFYQIYLLDLTSGESHRVSPGIGKTTCAFFRPGSSEVLFASTHLDPKAAEKQRAELEFRASGKQRRYSWDYDSAMDIFVANRDGSNIRRVTSTLGYDAEGAFSPDGSMIVFCSLRDAYPTNQLSIADRQRLETDPSWFGEIYLMNADGSNPRRLTKNPGYDGGPFFSPDGRRIVWRHFEATNAAVADVFTMNLDGTEVKRVTDFRSMSWAPYFHPSGKYLIFTSNKYGFGNFELHLVDADGRHEPVRVTFTDGFDGLPVFSPDGAKLCWTSGRTAQGQSQLFLAEWNHAAALAALESAPPREVAISGAPAATKSGGSWAESLRSAVEVLADEKMEGRMTGEKGARLAADYLANELHAAGLGKVGPTENFFQEFEYPAGVRVIGESNRLNLSAGAAEFSLEKDFRPLSFTSNGSVDGPVIFVGYGLTVPGAAGTGYDSYSGINVSNRIVLALRYVPEGVEAKRRAELNRYAGLRYKAMLAREHGARAILFATGPTSPNAGELAPTGTDTTFADSGIVAMAVGSNVVEKLFAATDKNLRSTQAALDTENPHAESGFIFSNVVASVSAGVEHVRGHDRNVLAQWTPPRAPQPAQYVMVGAHYDHLGRGASGSLQRKEEEGRIHAGADDNASGTALVLEMAKEFAKRSEPAGEPAARGVLFAFWSGEELGLMGSSYYAEHPLIPWTNVVAYLNFDMVGRLRDNKLILQGVGSSSAWTKWIEKRNVAGGFSLVLQNDPYLPTDTTAIYPKGVPVLNFFTGGHDDYHRPTDLPVTLNYEGLDRIAHFAWQITGDIAREESRPDYLAIVRSDAGGGGRENLRAYLGTIPDYATEVAGVKLSGVRGGSPADKAGLKGGDVIVEFSGQKIANIYDYTYALDAVKIGKPVEIKIIRDGKPLRLEATPEARK